MFDVLAAGLLIGATHAVPPGPITFEVVRRGVTETLASALKVDLGAVLADTVFFVLVMLGLMQLLNTREGKILVWICGCCMLLFLGLRGAYMSLSGKGNYSLKDRGDQSKKELSPLLTGFLICITSPFAIVWWTGVFAGSVALLGFDIYTMIIAYVGIAIACLVWYGLIGLTAAMGRKMIGEKTLKLMSMLCAAIMIVYAFILLYRGFNAFILI